jgi:pantothenate kinase
MVGIVGPPGSGKSTLAEALAARFSQELGPRAAVAVPMDGFHLSNVELDRLGLADRKGAPETFDGAGYVHLLQRLRSEADELVYAPAYSRVLHESIGGAIPVGPQVRLVVTEGNYLLVPEQPWAGVRPLLDLSVYLEVPDAARVAGLLRRQRSRGLDEEAARDWVERSDEANARLVATTRIYADAVLTRG